MENFTLTKKELEIMNLLWITNRPLSKSEIIELSPNRSWKESSIHIILNRLIEKKAIEVSGFIRTGKNYGRIYASVITQNDYIFQQFEKNTGSKSKSSMVTSIFATLIEDDDISNEAIKELEDMIENWKKKQ